MRNSTVENPISMGADEVDLLHHISLDEINQHIAKRNLDLPKPKRKLL